jgi:para-aminobenzoate synthetase component I
MNSYGKERKPFFFVIDYALQNGFVSNAQEAADENIFFQFPSMHNHSLKAHHSNISIQPFPIAFQEFEKSFLHIQKEIQYGNSFLCNLTASTPITCNANLKEIFSSTRAKYKILFRNDWTCFSPETFVQINNNTISTFPMKGTIDADLPNAEQTILQDTKETAEHYTIVDLLRNDLAMVSNAVQVEKFRYIDTIHTAKQNLLQVSSKIIGELTTDWHDTIGDILFSLLPAGSISGAPKKKTCEIISEAENHNRGYYTGIGGYYDSNSLDSCVLIRFIENNADGMVYKSGGGITYRSNAIDEYNELLQKIYIPTC